MSVHITHNQLVTVIVNFVTVSPGSKKKTHRRDSGCMEPGGNAFSMSLSVCVCVCPSTYVLVCVCVMQRKEGEVYSTYIYT